MKISMHKAFGLAVIAALTSNSFAQLDGEGPIDYGDPDGPFIDGDPNGPQDPGDPQTPQLRWSSFNGINAAQDRNLIDHFGDSVVVRRFGNTSAWGTLEADAGDTFAADARLPGVESAPFYTLAARGDSPTDNYAVMLRFDTGVMTHDDVLSIGQLFRDSAGSLTSARVQASYQGVALDLADFDVFNMDLTVAAKGVAYSADLSHDITGSLVPTVNGDNSDYLMLRPLDGVLVDKIDIFIDSTRPESPYADRVDIALGRFVVPAPGSVAVIGLGLLAAARRRR